MRFIFFCFFAGLVFGDEGAFSEGSWKIADMTVEEKVGQLLIVHFQGDSANEDAKRLIQKTRVGGIVYYQWANKLSSPEQVSNLSSSLQRLAYENPLSIPLLIAIDQEGGVVSRLQEGFSIFPGNRALGMTGDESLAENSALIIGAELSSVGINFNFAPVVDVNNNPKNPIIGVRSFGDSPELVARFGQSALSGYQRAGVITSLKHFPGHGDVEIDSHEDLPIIHKSKEALEKVELFPFSKLASFAPAAMTAHVMIPSIDPTWCATLSKKILGILREEIGFKGVIISDSLLMEGVLKNASSLEEASIRAFNAGCDLLLFGGKKLNGVDVGIPFEEVAKVHASLVQAVKEGRISQERLDEAVQRIFSLKSNYLRQKKSFHINSQESRSLAKKIASLALELIENHKLSLKGQRVVVFAPKLVQKEVEKATFPLKGRTKNFFFETLNPSQEDLLKIEEALKDEEVFIFCSYNAWKNPSQYLLAKSLLGKGKSFILISLRDPLDGELFKEADLIIQTLSPTEPSIEAAFERLFTEF